MLAMLATAPAFAQQTYVIGQVGRAEHNAFVEGESIKGSSTVAAVALGHKVTPNLAVEGGFAHLGKFSKTDSGYTIYAKPTTIYGALVGSFNATPAIALHAKVGIARTDTSVGYGFVLDVQSIDLDKTHALVGVGLSYAFTPKVAFVAEYTHLGTIAEDKELAESLKTSMFTAGVRFTF